MLIDKTLQVLEEKTVIPENGFKEVVETYYQLVKHSMSNDEANKLLENIARLEFEEILPQKSMFSSSMTMKLLRYGKSSREYRKLPTILRNDVNS